MQSLWSKYLNALFDFPKCSSRFNRFSGDEITWLAVDCKRKKIGPLWSLQQGAQKCDRSFHLFTFFHADLNRREVVMGYRAVLSAEEWYLVDVGQPRGSGRKTHGTRDLLIARELHVGYPDKTLHSTWRLCLSNMNFRQDSKHER